MSLQRINASDVVSPEEFVAKKAKIDEARKMLEALEEENRAGLQKYTQIEQEKQRAQMELLRQKQALERKVQEGLEAQRLIRELETIQSMALVPSPGQNESNHGGARIEEVPNVQQVQYSSQNEQSSRIQHQSQPQQSQSQYSVNSPQWQGYQNTGSVSANSTTQTQYSVSYQVANVHQEQQNRPQYASTSQQVQVPNTAVPSSHRGNPYAHQQPAPSFAGQSSSQTYLQTTFVPFYPDSRPKNPLPQSFQVYQPPNSQGTKPKTGAVPTVSNNSRSQVKPVANSMASSPNLSSQPSTSFTPRTSITAGSNASQTEQSSQPRVQPQERYIDTLGVPYLNITPEEIGSLRQHVKDWAVKAPPGARHHLHEMLVLYKDTHAQNPKTWIYVPWEPGSTKYARTSELDKFFDILSANARLVTSGVISVPRGLPKASSNQALSAQAPPAPKAAGNNNTSSISVPTTHPAIQTPFNGKNSAQVTNKATQPPTVSTSSAGTGMSAVSSSSIPAPIAPPAAKQTPVPLSSSTQASTVAYVANPNPLSSSSAQAHIVTNPNPTPFSSSTQAPPIVIPSGLTRNLPLPSQVDKKHLTKHILFALGKRPRTSFETSSSEQPAKRQAIEASSMQHPEVNGSNTPSSNIADRDRPGVQPVGLNSSASTTVPTSKDASPAIHNNTQNLSGYGTPSLATAQAPQAFAQNPAMNTQNSSNIHPPAISSSSIPAAAKPSAVVSTSAAPTANFYAADTAPRRQSLPSIAAARPDLTLQPTPIPATAAQTDVKMNSPPAPSSSSRLSVPPIETLKFDTGMVTSLADSTTTTTSATKNTDTMAAPAASASAQAAKNITMGAAASSSVATSKPSDSTAPLQHRPSSSVSSGVTAPSSGQTWRASLGTEQPTSTSSLATAPAGPLKSNPYTWLLSSPSSKGQAFRNTLASGSFSYNQITHGSFNASASQATEPLFLHSPASEAASFSYSQPVTSAEQKPVAKHEKKKEVKKREVMAYVLVPKADYPLQQHLGLREKEGMSETEITRNRLKSLRTHSSSVSTSVVGEEVLHNDFGSGNWRDSPLAADDSEGDAVRLAYSRLKELPCRWDGCNVRLNSVNKLVKHLRQHKPTSDPHYQHFTCRWTQCGRRCSLKDAHLENHALQPLRCAYEDCSESYRTPSQLVKHFKAKHINGTLKPSAELSTPDLTEPPPVPGIVPAYLFTTQVSNPATISPERHQVLCRLVVRNIVHSDQEKPKRTRKAARSTGNHTLTAGHDYEFIKTRTARYSSYLSEAVDLHMEDLDSEGITRMVDEGLMLWSPEGDGADVVDEARTPMMSRPTDNIKVEADEAVLRGADATDLYRHHHEHSSDEDAVEVMLTEVTVQ